MANGQDNPPPAPAATPLAGSRWTHVFHALPAPGPPEKAPYETSSLSDEQDRVIRDQLGLQPENYLPKDQLPLYRIALKKGNVWNGDEQQEQLQKFIRSTDGVIAAYHNLKPSDINAINLFATANANWMNASPEDVPGLTGKVAKAGFTQVTRSIRELQDYMREMGYITGQDKVNPSAPALTSFGGAIGQAIIGVANKVIDLAKGNNNLTVAGQFVQQANNQAKADYVNRASIIDKDPNQWVNDNIAHTADQYIDGFADHGINGYSDSRIAQLPKSPTQDEELEGVEAKAKGAKPEATPATASPTSESGISPLTGKPYTAQDQLFYGAPDQFGRRHLIPGWVMPWEQGNISPAPIATPKPAATPGAAPTATPAATPTESRSSVIPSAIGAPRLFNLLPAEQQGSTQAPGHAGEISTYQEYAGLPAGSRFTWAHDSRDYMKPPDAETSQTA